jgi:glycosyltransferase involved in cell wall biosynthesis
MQRSPSFAFVTIGSGDYLGSTVRDLAIANVLHRRGFKVTVYWMMESTPELADPGITHRMLCHGSRYHFRRPSEFLDRVLGPILFFFPKKLRVRLIQGRTGYVDRLLRNLVGSLFEPAVADRRLAQRLLGFVRQDGVSLLMMSFATTGALALAARNLSDRPFDYLLTFQGDEQFAAHAARLGLADRYRERLNEVIRQSRWPAMVVSRDYVDRIVAEMGVDRDRLQVIYNGIELPGRRDVPDFAQLKALFPSLVEGIPIVSYLGRQDSEKGVDLLLYAARLLAADNIPMQLVICGSTAKGESYRKVLSDLSGHLGLSIHHAGSVSPQIRDALFAHSHCVVYPSINREPFGLVVAEAMSFGTPVLVPDYGGITEVVRLGEQAGGLTFRTWDSGDLARQLGRLLVDEQLYHGLAANTRAMAARFSIDKMTDDILAHIGMGANAEAGMPASESVIEAEVK